MLTYSEYQLSSILYVLLCYELWRTHRLTSPPNIDVPDTCADNDVDHCDTDIHFFDGLLLFRGNVRRHFFYVLHYTQCGRYFGSVVDSDLEKSRRNVSNQVSNVTVKRVPVSHVTCGQYPTGTAQSTVSSLNTSGQLCDSSQGPSLDDLESGVGR